MKNFICCLFLGIFVFSLDAGIDQDKSSDPYSINILVGGNIQPILPYAEHMWLNTFREYPYLYEGTLQEAHGYFSWFAKLKYSAVAVIYYHDEPVGFLSGTSLVDFAEHYTESLAQFRKVGLTPEEYYYVSEVIIKKEHRGRSLSKKLFAAFENYIYSLGFKKSCLAAESHDMHPCKPLDYWELSNLWMNVGYTKTPAHVSFTWNTIQPDGSTMHQEHILRYWIKNLVA